jgi:hypothetical protein
LNHAQLASASFELALRFVLCTLQLQLLLLLRSSARASRNWLVA